MSNIIEITSLGDERIACYTRLTESELKNRLNADAGLFICEGEKVIGHALENGVEPVSFLMERAHIAGRAAQLLSACPDVPVYTGDSAMLTALTGFRMNRGFLCAMKRPRPARAEDILRGAGRIAVLEDIRDAANLGAIFRNAAALGMDGVLLSPACTDPLHRRCVKTSMGTVFQVPWAYLEGDWPREGIALIKDTGFTPLALALRGDAVPIGEMARAARPALLLGTEGTGLRDETVALCDRCVIIPMRAGVDSLNVAAAAAIAFWEVGKE